MSEVTIAFAHPGVVRAFYVLRAKNSTSLSEIGKFARRGESSVTVSFFNDIDDATQFAKLSDAVAFLAKRAAWDAKNDSSMLNVKADEFEIIRVDRETIPGLKAPATIERKVLGAFDVIPSDAKWAVRNAANGFLKSTTEPLRAFADDVKEALLFEREEEALLAVMEQAIERGSPWHSHHLVRIVEVETPAAHSPDTTNDTLTVL